jgi:hypothetical protein
MTASAQATTQSSIAQRIGPYNVARVEKISAPEGASGKDWYRYELDNGNSRIVGQRAGSLKDVTAHAQEYATQLNSRSGTTPSPWTSRNKK